MTKKLRCWLATHETWGDKSWHDAYTKREAWKSAMDYYRRNPAQGKPVSLEIDYGREQRQEFDKMARQSR